MVDFVHGFEMSASMMAAIKCQDDLVGVRGARSEWIWEFWQNDWVFRQESEVWGSCLDFTKSITHPHNLQSARCHSCPLY